MIHHGDQVMPESKRVRETEAEAVAFVVCQAVGLDTNSAASDYVQLYGGDRDTLVAGSDVRTEFDLPDVESRAGFEALEEHFAGFGAGTPGTIVFQSAEGFGDASTVDRIEAFLATVDELPDTIVTSPFTPPAQDPAAAAREIRRVLPELSDAEARRLARRGRR